MIDLGWRMHAVDAHYFSKTGACWFGFSCSSLILTLALMVVGFLSGCQTKSLSPETATGDLNSRESRLLTGWIVHARQVTADQIEKWKAADATIVLNLTAEVEPELVPKAAHLLNDAGLRLNYFIEVGRCTELADQHPEWMASLQVHPEWRKQFPDVPQPTRRQVVKNYPWVTIMNRESFDAHLQRIEKLLSGLPKAERLWLNDLQGAPSACGCGHPLCRWTADYGKVKTATQLGQDAAAKFVKQVRLQSGVAQVIPIFVGECEAEDEHTVCCGVACFEGKCWKDFTTQLDLVAAESPWVGVACFYREFDRDLPRYGGEAAWLDYTLDSFSKMPKLREGTGVEPQQLVAILQGWDVSPEQIQAQVKRATAGKVAGWLVCLSPIEQSWQPVIFDLPEDVADNSETQ